MSEFIPILDLSDLTLEELKNYRYLEIDNRTQELIAEGFVFDGRRFSMSINAQINWSNFPNLPDQVFPLPIMDMDENLYILSLENKLNFYLAALNFKNAQLKSGSALKAQIKACTNKECVNSIIDNR
jgi:hypothetical protein